MKRREQPEIQPDQMLSYESNQDYTPRLTVNLLIIEFVAQGPTHLWHVPQWIVWQLPIAYLYWRLIQERGQMFRLARAWNDRIDAGREKRPPNVSTLRPKAESDEQIRRWLAAGEKRGDADDGRDA